MSVIGFMKISELTTAAGTKVTKFLSKAPTKIGYGAIMKEIKYAPNSKLSQLGIDKVLIRDAGKEGKSIMAFGGEKCRFLGVTKPECKLERSVTSQFKEYIDAAKVLLQRGITIK